MQNKKQLTEFREINKNITVDIKRIVKYNCFYTLFLRVMLHDIRAYLCWK